MIDRHLQPRRRHIQRTQGCGLGDVAQLALWTVVGLLALILFALID